MEELHKLGFKRYLIYHHGRLIGIVVTNNPDSLAWYRNRKGYAIEELELKNKVEY